MGMGNILLLSQTAGYSVALILSLCVAIPMTIHMINFKGHCLLYTNGTFVPDDGRFEPDWASPGYCGFTLAVACFLLICSTVQLVRMSIFLYKGLDSSFLSAFMDALLAMVNSLVIIVAAVFVSGGFSYWCSAVTERFASCETASVMKIGLDSGIIATGFFIEMGSVQFGIWTSLVSWVLLLVLAARKLFVYHERENIIVSMARERQRYAGTGYHDVNEPRERF
jgi:hypothetical protein